MTAKQNLKKVREQVPQVVRYLPDKEREQGPEAGAHRVCLANREKGGGALWAREMDCLAPYPNKAGVSIPD